MIGQGFIVFVLYHNLMNYLLYTCIYASMLYVIGK